MTKLDEIEARLNAILDNQNDGLKLSAAIDAFDATVVDDVAYLLAEVKRLEGDLGAAQKALLYAVDEDGCTCHCCMMGTEHAAAVQYARKLADGGA